uniref:non-specific serine/threonine protein kinase n=1 Tax=Setaria italica TaxID=4555 RepID=K3ZF83_SETIT
EFVYNGFANANLSFEGEASIDERGRLGLTTGLDIVGVGHAFYRYPISFRKTPSDPAMHSFTTSFLFEMTSLYEHYGSTPGSDGVAFVISSTNKFLNDSLLPGPYLGLFNMSNRSSASRNILAIELGTIMNPKLNDIDDNHVAININSLISVNYHTAGFYTPDGGFQSVRLNMEQVFQLWVDYDGKAQQLNVTLGFPGSPKPKYPLLSNTLNLSSLLPSELFVGFSASTSTLSTRHFILGWSFKTNGEASQLNYSAFQAAGNTKESDWEMNCGPPSFTYKDLVSATGGFKDKMLLGKGGFGRVYKGFLPASKQNVAIKRISPESKQGTKEFASEVTILGHVRHRSLVRWSQRFCIIKSVASGLFYLHEEWEHVVIHRDIKSSNVLLDDAMNGRLGDFGLARLHDHGVDAHTTRIAGTFGYIAPELARLGKATKAADVFAFGVFMREVTCGRRPVEVNACGEPQVLADHVINAWQDGSIMDSRDPRLEDCVAQEVEMVLKLGLLCSHPSPKVRPGTRLVMRYLENVATLPDFPLNFFNADPANDEVYDQFVASVAAATISLSGGR